MLGMTNDHLRRGGFAAVLALAAGVSGTLARAQPPGDPSPTVEELHEDLRTLKRTMETALNDGDVDTIVANVDDNVIFTTMNGDVVRGPEAIREYFAKMMQGDDRVVNSITSNFEADDLSVLYDDTAIAFGQSHDHYELASGDDFEVDARWSSTMVRRDDRWIIANFHYSANMFDNPVLAAQRTILLWVVGGAAIVFALAGFLVGRRRGRTTASGPGPEHTT